MRPARRGRWLAWWCLASLVAMVASFVGGLFVRSPWDQANVNAQSNPIVTDSATQRDFTPDQPLAQATVALGRETTVSLPPRDSPAIVTRRFVQPGSVIRSGSALVEVSGRPVFALSLPFGLYRTIAPGDKGPDVLAVQRALSALRVYPANAIDGVYGTTTSRAVDAMYAAARVNSPAPSPGLADTLRNAERALAATTAQPGTVRYRDLLRARATAAAKAATPLPMSEVVAIGPGKLSIVTIPQTGAVLTGDDSSKLRFRGGRPTATGRVSVLGKDTYPAGAHVLVRSADVARKPLRGTVSGVSEFQTDDPAGYDIKVDLVGDLTHWSDGDTATIGPAEPATKVTGLGVALTGIREDAQGFYVWIRSSSRDVRRVAVTVGEERDGYVRVTSGPLRQGDQVVVAGR